MKPKLGKIINTPYGKATKSNTKKPAPIRTVR